MLAAQLSASGELSLLSLRILTYSHVRPLAFLPFAARRSRGEVCGVLLRLVCLEEPGEDGGPDRRLP